MTFLSEDLNAAHMMWAIQLFNSSETLQQVGLLKYVSQVGAWHVFCAYWG